MRYSLTILFFVLLPVTTLFAQPAAEQLQKADSILQAHVQPNGPGLSLSVMHKGEIILSRQQGYANLEHRVPITDTTQLLVGSISKQFTCFAALLLEAEGKLSLEDPVQVYLPELDDLPYPITLRQLANHTNGFRNSYDLNAMRGKSEEDISSQSELLALLFRQKNVNFAPGERFKYNNAAYVLLAEVIARVSGVTFPEFVQDRIFEPLQMTRSSFVDNPYELIYNLADSYRLTQKGYQHMPIYPSTVGSSGLYTTPTDLLKWSQNMLSPTVGTPALVAKAQAPSTLNNGNEIPYGLGQETKQYKGLRVVFHGGGDAGYRAYLLQVPALEFSVAVSGNYHAFNPLDLAYGMIDIFLAEHLQDTPVAVPAYTTASLKTFEGTFQVFPGQYFNFVAQNDRLYLQPWGNEERTELPVLAKNEFAVPFIPHSRFVFDGDSLTWHLSDFFYPGKRVTLDPPTAEEIPTADYLGSFYSDEVQTTYTIIEREGILLATHPAYSFDIPLTPVAKDIFISTEFFISRLEFQRDENGAVTHCLISSQDVYDVAFDKE